MILKKVFNTVFSEKQKEKIRGIMPTYIEWYDKRLYYKKHLDAYKKVAKNIVFNSSERYGYRENELFVKIRKTYLKDYIFREFKTGFEEEKEYIKNHEVSVFNYEDMHQVYYHEEDIMFDPDKELPYTYLFDKRVYHPKCFTREMVANSMNALRNEQNETSPHRYISDKIKVEEGDVIFDVGAAEGNFSVEVIDKAKHIYLFEPDPIWVEALEATFAPYNDKVTIISKFVSDFEDDQTITLDSFIKENNIEKVDCIKMDVEGYEKNVLNGLKEALDQDIVEKLFVCAYHNYDDEQMIEEKLNDKYELEKSERYMVAVWYDVWEIRKPIFVRGVVRAKKKR